LIPPLAAKLREADGILNVPVTSQKALPISWIKALWNSSS